MVRRVYGAPGFCQEGWWMGVYGLRGEGMKLTDFLQDVGRPVAYYPSLRRITGSTNATILLCQFIYWRGKEADPEGWLYKDSTEIEQETGLSYGEQKTARRDLIAAGLIEEHYARLDHQMKFRLILEAINDKWGTQETSIPESGKPQFGNEGNLDSLNESEITTESTTGVPQNFPVEWYVQHGLPVPKALIDQNQLSSQALGEFESKMGFSSLPWDSTDSWVKFKKWVIVTYSARPTAWRDYAEWRKDKGKYDAMNNKQIRMNTGAFMDTGWPSFLASSAMYDNQEKVRLL